MGLVNICCSVKSIGLAGKPKPNVTFPNPLTSLSLEEHNSAQDHTVIVVVSWVTVFNLTFFRVHKVWWYKGEPVQCNRLNEKSNWGWSSEVSGYITAALMAKWIWIHQLIKLSKCAFKAIDFSLALQIGSPCPFWDRKAICQMLWSSIHWWRCSLGGGRETIWVAVVNWYNH